MRISAILRGCVVRQPIKIVTFRKSVFCGKCGSICEIFNWGVKRRWDAGCASLCSGNREDCRMTRGVFRVNLTPICDRLGRGFIHIIWCAAAKRLFSKIHAKTGRIPMNTGFSVPVPFEIDRATPMWENHKHDVQTQVVSAFGGVSATGGEVGSNLCPDEKGTERLGTFGYVPSVATSPYHSVATYTPMKRGLKDHDAHRKSCQ